MTHDLKILPSYFDAVLSGDKTFELRRFDRPYAVGDILHLREFRDGLYTGRCADFEVTYILADSSFGLAGYCIMAIRPWTR